MKQRKFYAAAFLCFFLISALILSASISMASSRFRISNGKLYMEKSLVIESFSVVKAEPAYLFFYLPDFGLITVATTDFAGAKSDGLFQGARLDFVADGSSFALIASDPILGSETRTAWVSVDKRYSLDTKSAIAGYGDDSKAPYHWPIYVRQKQ
jgi:hypothetical protein